MMFDGIRIVESIYLVEPGDPIEIRRSWRERLFSRPWTPLKTTRTLIPNVPYKGAIRIDNTTIVMHPETVRQFRAAAALEEEKKFS